MSTQVTPDVDTLRRAVQEKYTEVAEHPERTFNFHHGRPLAEILGYPMDKVDAMPPDAKDVELVSTGDVFAGAEGEEQARQFETLGVNIRARKT